jgi:hypothetical protein
MNSSSPPAWAVFGATVRGASHLRSGLPNQDAIDWSPRAGADDGGPRILAVADGHGSAKSFRSGRGAVFAVRVTLDLLGDFARAYQDKNVSLSGVDRAAAVDLPRSIVEKWKEKVHADRRNRPFTADELDPLDLAARRAVDAEPLVVYGATLLAVLLTERFLLYLQLGDGDILTVAADGRVTRPLPPDERLFANETTSLCSPGGQGKQRNPSRAPAGAWSEFRVRVQPLIAPYPALILASTDGYANSFGSEADFLKVGSDLLDLLRSDGLGKVNASLGAWLEEASRSGSGDDVTLGCLFPPDSVAPALPTSREAAAADSGPAAAVNPPEGAPPGLLESAERLLSLRCRTGTSDPSTPQGATDE